MLKDAPRGLSAIGAFLFFGATMAGLAGITLAFPGTILDGMWRLNRDAYVQMAPLGPAVGCLFLLLSVALAVAGIGWLRRRYWGWLLAIAIIATQVLGDFVNFIRGDYLRGGVGVIIAGALLYYMTHPRVRSAFPSA